MHTKNFGLSDRTVHKLAGFVMAVLTFLVPASLLADDATQNAKKTQSYFVRGTYHPDRWGQGHFNSEYWISPKLAHKLKPFRGLPIDLEVTKATLKWGIWNGPWVVHEVGRTKKLPMPVRFQIEWQAAQHAKSVEFNRLKTGESLKLKVTATNQTSTRLSLDGGHLNLIVYRHHPATTDKSGRIGYFSEIGSGVVNASLFAKDETLNALKLSSYLRPGKLNTGEFLESGKSRTWTVTLANFPANEYEVNIGYIYYLGKKKGYRYNFSNVLRFDVLTDKPQSWQGLEVSLEPDADRKPSQPRSIPMRVRFKNTDEKPLRFALWKDGDQWDVSQDVLLCYDARGTLLPLPKPKAKLTNHSVRLEKGKDLKIPVDVPEDTKVARVAFHHRFDLTKFAKPDERVLEGDIYVFSRHVLFDSKEEKDKQK